MDAPGNSQHYNGAVYTAITAEPGLTFDALCRHLIRSDLFPDEISWPGLVHHVDDAVKELLGSDQVNLKVESGRVRYYAV
jgi:hypothetical protein